MNHRRSIVGAVIITSIIVVLVILYQLQPIGLRTEPPIALCKNNLVSIYSRLNAKAYQNPTRAFPDKLEDIIEGFNQPAAGWLMICPFRRKYHHAECISNVSEWSDYVVVPGRSANDPADTILAFCKTDNHKGEAGVNCILYVDGRIRPYPLEEHRRLTSAFTVSNTTRRLESCINGTNLSSQSRP